MTQADEAARVLYLLAESRGFFVALPLAQVQETMRPRPTLPLNLADLPEFVRGVAVIRGASVPVVDAGLLIRGEATDRPTRFVTLPVGDNQLIALMVEGRPHIVGLRPETADTLPALLGQCRSDHVEYLSSHGRQLLIALRTAYIVAPELLARIEQQAEARE